ncbi:MAG: putative sulfate exporter family transporter [Sphaerochaeta sp.]
MKQRIMVLIPGIILTALIAAVAQGLGSLGLLSLVGPSVWALLIGICLHPVAKQFAFFQEGIGFTAKKLLRFAIIGMGFTLNLTQVLSIGSFSAIVMLFTLVTAFGGGYLLGKILGLDWRQSALISAGTGICGASAIAALAPVIDGDEEAIAWALSATFIFDVAMVILFPLMGRALAMSDIGYGLWAGTAVNDTSSVLAAGYAFSEEAGSFAIIVKLARTLSIVPIAILFSWINGRSSQRKQVSLQRIFPWFIILFLAAVLLNSLSLIPPAFGAQVAKSGRFIMVMALGAVGLSTDARAMACSATKPMTHGFIISVAVVLVSYLVQALLNQI